MKKVLLILLIVFVLMQFFQPDKNVSETIPDTDFIVMNQPPEAVATILKTSCYDCHSNNTHYPWYNKVAPVSYILANHVNDGKKHLNFSEWGNYNIRQKAHALDEIIEEVEHRKMPMTSYISMHEEAAMSNEEIATLTEYLDRALGMTELQQERAH